MPLDTPRPDVATASVQPTARPGMSSLDPAIAARLKRSTDGLLPAIAQDATTGAVLMLAWMDDEALARTLATRQATYWSRSRGEYWVKGLTSGHTQHVRSVRLDCDGDTLLLVVDQVGGACHTGDTTCFDAGELLSDLPFDVPFDVPSDVPSDVLLGVQSHAAPPEAGAGADGADAEPARPGEAPA